MLALWRRTITRPTPMTTWPPWLFSTQGPSTRTLECIVFFSQRVVTHCTLHRTLTQVRAVSVIHPIHMRSWCVRFSLDFDFSFLFTFYLTHLLSHSFHFFPHLNLVNNLLRIPPKNSMDSFDETYLHTSYERNAYDFKETSVEPYTQLLNSPPFFSDKGFPRTPNTMTLHSRVCFVKLTEYIAITLNEKICLSVSRRRLCPKERCDLLEKGRGDLLSKVARMHKWGLCSTSKKSKFLPSTKQKSTDTNFKPLSTEERNWVKLLNLKKKNFTAFELKKFNEEINSFFQGQFSVKWKS